VLPCKGRQGTWAITTRPWPPSKSIRSKNGSTLDGICRYQPMIYGRYFKPITTRLSSIMGTALSPHSTRSAGCAPGKPAG